MRPPIAATKLPLTENDFDPRLVHAQAGHFAAAHLSGQLTAAENSYYRQQNRNYEQAQLQRQQQSLYTSAAPARMDGQLHASNHTTSVHESPRSQRHGLPSVYTPQQTFCPPSLSTQTNAAAQMQRPMQISQPQTTILTTASITQPSGPYVPEQHAWPQFQPAQLPIPQHDSSSHTPRFFSKLPQGQPVLPGANSQLQLPRHPQFQILPGQQQHPQQQSRLMPEGHSTPQVPNALPKQNALPPHQTPPPTTAPNNISSSDFAHLRGDDWSNAAQQRAREIAAKITSQERDTMAQSIIQRHQSLAQQPPSLAPATRTHIPTAHVPDEPPRSHPAPGLSDNQTDRVHFNAADAPSYANASLYAHAPANLPTGTTAPYTYALTRGTAAPRSGWGMVMPESGARDSAPLPTLEQVRSRYGHQPSRLQSETLGMAEATFTSVAHMYGRFAGLGAPGQGQVRAQDPVQAEHSALLPQRGVQQSWASGRADALQQLRHAAGQKSGGSVHSWPGDGVVGSPAQETDGTGSCVRDGAEDVEMYGT